MIKWSSVQNVRVITFDIVRRITTSVATPKSTDIKVMSSTACESCERWQVLAVVLDISAGGMVSHESVLRVSTCCTYTGTSDSSGR